MLYNNNLKAGGGKIRESNKNTTNARVGYTTQHNRYANGSVDPGKIKGAFFPAGSFKFRVSSLLKIMQAFFDGFLENY
jgi:hypothetical protein